MVDWGNFTEVEKIDSLFLFFCLVLPIPPLAELFEKAVKPH